MAKIIKKVASDFAGSHAELMELLSKARKQKLPNNLDKLTVKELRELAKKNELKGYSTLNKADLIALISEESAQ
tara:strand:+ start:268 stop:489 length:222 start_codon:yes stop_codon:yes gene_type:complete